MTNEKALEVLKKADGMTKDQIKDKIGLDVTRNACARYRDRNDVPKDEAKMAFNVYKKIRNKEGRLTILENLAAKAGLKYDEKEVEKKEAKATAKAEKKAAPAKKEAPAKAEKKAAPAKKEAAPKDEAKADAKASFKSKFQAAKERVAQPTA